jgi:hypothetical protein
MMTRFQWVQPYRDRGGNNPSSTGGHQFLDHTKIIRYKINRMRQTDQNFDRDGVRNSDAHGVGRPHQTARNAPVGPAL